MSLGKKCDLFEYQGPKLWCRKHDVHLARTIQERERKGESIVVMSWKLAISASAGRDMEQRLEK